MPLRFAPLRLVLMLAACVGCPAIARAADDVAQVRRATAYLDARQDAWAKFPHAQHGQGPDRTSCVSCHTAMPYACARAALGRFTGEAYPSPQSKRMVDQVRLRVAHWDELDSPRFRLLSDSDARKKVESRGTEAVLNTLILALDDAARGRKAPGESTRAALRHLWATQTAAGDDAGSWEWFNFGEEPWEADDSRAFGAALAAIAIGSSPGYRTGALSDAEARGVERLRSYLRRRLPVETLYNRVWILFASTVWDGLLTPDEQRAVVAPMLAKQRADGGWALATLGPYERIDGSALPRDSDAYATGLVLHVLRRSQAGGVQPAFAKGRTWLLTHQRDDGSWPASSMNKRHDPSSMVGKFMSDAGTAFAALVIAETTPP